MEKKTVLKVLSVVGMVGSFGLSLIGSYIDDKKMEDKIDTKVNEKLKLLKGE